MQQNSAIETFEVHTLAEDVWSGEPVKVDLGRRDSQPLMSPDELNGFSRAFFQRLMEGHTDWCGRTRVLSGDDCDGALFIEVTAPNPMLNLWISTEEGQVTVGFGTLYHAHFVVYETESKTFDAAIDFVDRFLGEEIVLVAAMRGDRASMSWTQYSGENPRRPLPGSSHFPPPDSLRILSWRSTHDRRIALE